MNPSIVAISTPSGSGGIAVVRLSGPDAFAIADRAWRGAPLSAARSHTAHFGRITDADGSVLDEAVATLFRAPNSFTGEDTVEFSLHGSLWIQRRVMERLMALGATPAAPGEFTRRAFLNGRMDLSQAEAVADLIAASSRAAHRLAISQMSGAFSRRLETLRGKLVELASLLELELDFSEEDVTFADRERLVAIADETLALIDRLTSSYSTGRALKDGVPVAIAGAPNAGKSTLLNRLLDDEKAIVSDIPGTTRDVIEDTAEIGGILFRFFDTAGLRQTDDPVENIGIDRARQTIDRAAIVLWMIDAADTPESIQEQINQTKVQINAHPQQKHLLLLNKSDLQGSQAYQPVQTDPRLGGQAPPPVQTVSSQGAYQPVPTDSGLLPISAKTGLGIDTLSARLGEMAAPAGHSDEDLIVTNARHQAALTAGAESLRRARAGIADGLSADFVAQDIRESLHHLGEVTGAVTTDNLLSTIFSRFCIGK